MAGIDLLYYYYREQFKVVTETAAPAFMPHLKFIKALPTHPECRSIPIRYVATLDPPVPVSDEVCQKLMNVTGLSSLDTVSQVPYNPSIMSLEDMLVMHVADSVSFSNNWVSVSSIKERERERERGLLMNHSRLRTCLNNPTHG